jgi:hypothetical protein
MRLFDGRVVAVRVGIVVGRSVDGMLDDGCARGRVYRLGERKPGCSTGPCISLRVLSNEFLLGPPGWGVPLQLAADT